MSFYRPPFMGTQNQTSTPQSYSPSNVLYPHGQPNPYISQQSYAYPINHVQGQFLCQENNQGTPDSYATTTGANIHLNPTAVSYTPYSSQSKETIYNPYLSDREQSQLVAQYSQSYAATSECPPKTGDNALINSPNTDASTMSTYAYLYRPNENTDSPTFESKRMYGSNSSVGYKHASSNFSEKTSPSVKELNNQTEGSTVEDVFKAKASQYGIDICTKAERIARKVAAEAEAAKMEKERQQPHVDVFRRKAMNCGIHIGPSKGGNHKESSVSDLDTDSDSKDFCKQEIHDNLISISNKFVTASSINAKEDISDNHVSLLNASEYKQDEEGEETPSEKLSSSQEEVDSNHNNMTETYKSFLIKLSHNGEVTNFDGQNSLNGAKEEDSSFENSEEESATPEAEGIEGNMVLETLKTLCSPKTKKLPIKNKHESKVLHTKKGMVCHQRKNEDEMMTNFNVMVSSYVDWIIQHAAQQLALEKPISKLTNNVRDTEEKVCKDTTSTVENTTSESSLDTGKVSSDVCDEIPDAGTCNSNNSSSVTCADEITYQPGNNKKTSLYSRSWSTDTDPIMKEEISAPSKEFTSNEKDRYQCEKILNLFDLSSLNPASPEFKPGTTKPSKGKDFPCDSGETSMRADAPVFKPTARSVIHNLVPKVISKSVKDKIIQTECKQYSDIAVNTKRIKQKTIATETSTCDVREVCINTVESLFAEDSDFHVDCVTYNSQYTNTDKVESRSVGVNVRPPKTGEKKDQGCMTDPLHIYQRLLSTQRELLHLRGQVCIMELQRQIDDLERNKQNHVHVFLAVDDGSFEATINAGIALLKTEIDTIKDKMQKCDKELDEGNIWETVPQFTVSIPVGHDSVSVINKNSFIPQYKEDDSQRKSKFSWNDYPLENERELVDQFLKSDSKQEEKSKLLRPEKGLECTEHMNFSKNEDSLDCNTAQNIAKQIIPTDVNPRKTLSTEKSPYPMDENGSLEVSMVLKSDVKKKILSTTSDNVPLLKQNIDTTLGTQETKIKEERTTDMKEVSEEPGDVLSMSYNESLRDYSDANQRRATPPSLSNSKSVNITSQSGTLNVDSVINNVGSENAFQQWRSNISIPNTQHMHSLTQSGTQLSSIHSPVTIAASMGTLPSGGRKMGRNIVTNQFTQPQAATVPLGSVLLPQQFVIAPRVIPMQVPYRMPPPTPPRIPPFLPPMPPLSIAPPQPSTHFPPTNFVPFTAMATPKMTTPIESQGSLGSHEMFETWTLNGGTDPRQSKLPQQSNVGQSSGIASSSSIYSSTWAENKGSQNNVTDELRTMNSHNSTSPMFHKSPSPSHGNTCSERGIPLKYMEPNIGENSLRKTEISHSVPEGSLGHQNISCKQDSLFYNNSHAMYKDSFNTVDTSTCREAVAHERKDSSLQETKTLHPTIDTSSQIDKPTERQVATPSSALSLDGESSLKSDTKRMENVLATCIPEVENSLPGATSTLTESKIAPATSPPVSSSVSLHVLPSPKGQHAPESTLQVLPNQGDKKAARSTLQVLPYPENQQAPESTLQVLPNQGDKKAPESTLQVLPYPEDQQAPKSTLQVLPNQGDKKAPESTLQVLPNQGDQQAPKSTLQVLPNQGDKKAPESTLQVLPNQGDQQAPESTLQVLPYPEDQQAKESTLQVLSNQGDQQTPESTLQVLPYSENQQESESTLQVLPNQGGQHTLESTLQVLSNPENQQASVSTSQVLPYPENQQAPESTLQVSPYQENQQAPESTLHVLPDQGNQQTPVNNEGDQTKVLTPQTLTEAPVDTTVLPAELPPTVDPNLYKIVLAQLKQVYPDLATNPLMLNSVAVQQTQILQCYVAAGNMGGAAGIPGLSGNLSVQPQPESIPKDTTDSTTNSVNVSQGPSITAEQKEGSMDHVLASQGLKRPPGLGDPDVRDSIPDSLLKSKASPRLHTILNEQKSNTENDSENDKVENENKSKSKVEVENKSKSANMKKIDTNRPKSFLDSFRKVEPPQNVVPKVSSIPPALPKAHGEERSALRETVPFSNRPMHTIRGPFSPATRQYDGPSNLPPHLINRSESERYGLDDFSESVSNHRHELDNNRLSQDNYTCASGNVQSSSASVASGENWEEEIDQYNAKPFKLTKEAVIPKRISTSSRLAAEPSGFTRTASKPLPVGMVTKQVDTKAGKRDWWSMAVNDNVNDVSSMQYSQKVQAWLNTSVLVKGGATSVEQYGRQGSDQLSEASDNDVISGSKNGLMDELDDMWDDSYGKEKIDDISDISLPVHSKSRVGDAIDNEIIEENDDGESWQQVSKKKKKSEPTVARKRKISGDTTAARKHKSGDRTAASRGESKGTASQQKNNNFEKLVTKMSETFNTLTRQEIIQTITEVREQMGGLSGLTMMTILEKAKEVIYKRKTKKSTQQAPLQPTDSKIKVVQSIRPALLPTPGSNPQSHNQFVKDDFPPARKNVLTIPGRKATTSKPLSMSVISSGLDTNFEPDDDEDICVICHDGLSTEENKSLDCGHVFHAECIKQWVFSRERTCPTCRRLALFPEEFPRLGK